MEFDSILTGLAATAIVTAIIAAGAVKASPNFAKWGANKLAGFFGR